MSPRYLCCRTVLGTPPWSTTWADFHESGPRCSPGASAGMRDQRCASSVRRAPESGHAHSGSQGKPCPARQGSVTSWPETRASRSKCPKTRRCRDWSVHAQPAPASVLRGAHRVGQQGGMHGDVPHAAQRRSKPLPCLGKWPPCRQRQESTLRNWPEISALIRCKITSQAACRKLVLARRGVHPVSLFGMPVACGPAWP